MSETPLMQQYREIKARHQDAILFFRMGDFFEMFYEDAEIGSRVLGLTLTSRNNGGAASVPLAGVPAKAVSEYVKRLVRKGFRVAICEQVEDPKYAKGPVRREVIETVTPGAALADDLLDGARNNFLCALHRTGPGTGPGTGLATGSGAGSGTGLGAGSGTGLGAGSGTGLGAGSGAGSGTGLGTGSGAGSRTGLAAVDVSTGEFRLATAPASDAAALLARYSPREILIARGATVGVPIDGVLVTEREPWEFDAASGAEALARRFGVQSLEGFGVQSSDAPAVAAAGALLEYLRELQPGGLPHLARPVVERPGGSVPLDEMTRRNLELVESLRGEAAGTLLDVLDRTSTPMGARLLRQWILAPLSDRSAINARLDRVEALANDSLARAALRDALDGVRDIERLAGKVAASRATPRELRWLGDSLARLPDVSAAAARVGLAEPWDTCDDISTAITRALVERPPIAIGEEPTIAIGVDPGVDELRVLRDGGKDAIAEIQAAERARTGIASLKVGYNRVFGYFIEVTNANKDAVPADYQRRQTLTGAERYVTPALKEYEERVLTAAERLEARERELFEALRSATGAGIARLQHVARRVAELDVVATFAEVAERERFVRPVVTDDLEIDIVGGRHPVVERMMPREQFIPNDVRLSAAERVIILTGPNMAGKSTILRQVGLIVLLAQAGSFVPAARATIGIVDRLFTRVGASDNLVRGQSTFMVEMAETSAILHTATARSLVLLDEIGRGTSTYDGVSIAWSVTEHLHSRVGCKTIFATHYHELTQLADELPALRNYNVAVREVGDRILFLHRMQPGGADRSYGIEVGRLAGLPDAVITRAREVLRRLESEQLVASRPVEQLALFAPEPHAAIKRLAALNPDDMTPLQALTLLAELKGLV